MLADAVRIREILVNILSNAVKFTDDGGSITFETGFRPGEDGHIVVCYRISDTGVGMSEEFAEHIFEEFAQEESGTRTQYKGTGLGMAITKRYVDLMGGTISVESKKGEGSVFTVELPLDLTDESRVPRRELPAAETDLTGVRILLAEDNDLNAEIAMVQMEELGIQVTRASDGSEAVKAFTSSSPDTFDLILMDIILTAYDWSDIEEEAREAGVTAFVMKPLFMSELREVLTRPVRAEAGLEEPEEPVDFTGKRILLVEDNELNQEIAAAILKDAGFLVDVADDGIVAVEKMVSAPSGSYDLILMDVQMPRMNGFIAAREIRTLSDNKKANIPVVAMTANAFDEDRKLAFEAGMNGFVAKPISVEVLLRTLSDILK